MRTLKIEAVHPMAYENFEADLPGFHRSGLQRQPTALSAGYLSPQHFEDQHARLTVKSAAWSCLPPRAHFKT